MTVSVAYDMTPAIGVRTGIGNVVSHLYNELTKSENTEILPYTLSYKARAYKDELPNNNIFITIPARFLLKFWQFSNFPRLDKQLGDFDILHATNYLAPPTKGKQLITIHDVTMLKYPELVSQQVRELAPVIKKRLNDGAHVHVPAQAIAEDVIKYFGDSINSERIHVAPFASTDLVEGKPTTKIESLCKGDPFILSIGALEPRKNHARLIESFGQIYEVIPHVRLFLVGPDGPARPEIDRAMENLSPEARTKIFITGTVTDVDRTYLLTNATIVAYPSLYEGFGLPLLEAMTTQTPVVTSKEGSLEEVAGDSALFIDPLSSQSIAEGIIKLLENEQMRNELVEKGKNRLNEYSWEKSAEMLSNIYKKIVKDI